MRIIHICLAGPFSEGYSYQENLLSKYHVRLGHEVFVITSNWVLNNEGIMCETIEKNYINNDGVKIIRIKMKGKNNYLKKIKRFQDYSKILNEIRPDIIFIHGSQFINIQPIILYKKENLSTKIFVDNHADFSNSAKNIFSRELLHKIIWRKITLDLEPYVNEFFGVLPARSDFLEKIYRVPKNKISLLNMGGDDDFVNKNTNESTNQFKKSIGCNKNQVLLVTGGKIDESKKEVLLLMEYVKSRKDIFLLIFGSIDEQIKPLVHDMLSENIKHIGWVNTAKSYEIFSSSDLVVFPGRHSVYWEQVVSQKKPMLVKRWYGTDHIDIGGNISFVEYSYNDKEKLFEELSNILYTPKLQQMKDAAESNKSEAFLYSNIGKRSIGEYRR